MSALLLCYIPCPLFYFFYLENGLCKIAKLFKPDANLWPSFLLFPEFRNYRHVLHAQLFVFHFILFQASTLKEAAVILEKRSWAMRSYPSVGSDLLMWMSEPSVQPCNTCRWWLPTACPETASASGPCNWRCSSGVTWVVASAPCWLDRCLKAWVWNTPEFPGEKWKDCRLPGPASTFWIRTSGAVSLFHKPLRDPEAAGTMALPYSEGLANAKNSHVRNP